MTIYPWLVAIIIIGLVAFTIISVIWGIRAHRHQVSVGREELVGKVAMAKTALDPKGTVFIQGELWTAILGEGKAKPGEEVIITRSDGLKLWVAKQTAKGGK